MVIIDGMDGVIAVIEQERFEAMEAARTATRRDIRARFMGRVQACNSLIATFENAHLSVAAPDGSVTISYPTPR
jgi:hypothetical protein